MLKRLLTDNALLGLQYAASALVPLLLVPHIVRSIGAAPYGRIAIALAAMSLASVVVQYAFHLTGPADYAQAGDARARRQVFIDVALARLLLLGATLVAAVLALVLFAAATGRSPGDPTLAHWWLLLALPVGAAFHSGWYLQAAGRLAGLAAISIVATLVALAVGFTRIRAGETDAPTWAAIALVLGPLVAGVGTFAASVAIGRVADAKASLARAARAITHGRAVFGSQVFAALYALAGPIVVGAAAGERAAGLYSAVERIAAALLAALTLTHTAAYPRLAGFYANDRPAYLHLVRLVVGLHGAGALALGVLLLAFFAPLSRFVLAEASAETALLLGLAWLWLALGIHGPLLTGYLTVSGARADIMRLTWQVLLVSLPAGCAGAVAFGGAGWLAALVLGQAWVLVRAVSAYRREAATLHPRRLG